MKHTTMSMNRADSSLVASVKVVPLALQAVGLWVEDIVVSLQVSVSVRTIDHHHQGIQTVDSHLIFPGVDNVLEFTIVLANGTLITTNAYQYPDLFWALQGGGGGTYGVVLSATYQTHPKFPLTISILQVNFTSPAIAQSVVTELFRLHTDLSDAGWGGRTQAFPEFMGATFIAPNVTVDDANKRLEPLVSFATNATGGAVLHTTSAYGSFMEWWKPYSRLPGNAGGNVEIASRLLPRELAKEHPEEVARIALSLGAAIEYVYLFFPSLMNILLNKF
jgi:hypothetical protein